MKYLFFLLFPVLAVFADYTFPCPDAYNLGEVLQCTLVSGSAIEGMAQEAGYNARGAMALKNLSGSSWYFPPYSGTEVCTIMEREDVEGRYCIGMGQSGAIHSGPIKAAMGPDSVYVVGGWTQSHGDYGDYTYMVYLPVTVTSGNPSNQPPSALGGPDNNWVYNKDKWQLSTNKSFNTPPSWSGGRWYSSDGTNFSYVGGSQTWTFDDVGFSTNSGGGLSTGNDASAKWDLVNDEWVPVIPTNWDGSGYAPDAVVQEAILGEAQKQNQSLEAILETLNKSLALAESAATNTGASAEDIGESVGNVVSNIFSGGVGVGTSTNGVGMGGLDSSDVGLLGSNMLGSVDAWTGTVQQVSGTATGLVSSFVPVAPVFTAQSDTWSFSMPKFKHGGEPVVYTFNSAELFGSFRTPLRLLCALFLYVYTLTALARASQEILP